MPTVRKLQGTQVAAGALPGARLTASETPDSLGAGAKRASAQTWATAAHVAGTGAALATDLANQQREKANQVKALEWQGQVDNFELNTLHDPETGALNMRGKNALGIPEKVDEQYRELTGTIEQGLANDEQRRAFQAFKQQRGANIALTVRRHVAGEMQAYDASELKATLGNAASLAAANALDPRRAGQEIARGEDEIIKAANRHGVGPEVYEAQVEAFHTAAHTGIINNLLASGNERAAEVYYEEKKGEIAGDKRDDVEKAIEAGTTAKKGRTASDGIWATMGPKSDSQPIDLAAMEDKARAQFPDDDKALKATMQNLRERKAALDASRQDRKEATAGALWGAVAKGASLSQVQSMPEYRSADGKTQAQISEHIVQEAEQRASRDFTRRQRALGEVTLAENQKERAGWAEMWRIENPEVLSKMTDNQILALTPTLGIDHVNRLMTKRRALSSSEATVRAAAIDDDLFKTTAAASGLDAYSPKTDQEKSDLGQLRNAVETAIDQEQTSTGKALTRERKQAIMRSLTDQKVMLNTWGSDPERVAATVVNPEDVRRAYVPVTKIPALAKGQYLNYIRSVSPAASGMNDAQVLEKFGDRIQRAYARRMLGGSRADIEAIIQGQD